MNYNDKANKTMEEMDFKQMDENYSYIVEQHTSDFLHRGDVHQATRLLGYVDAMMATCATFLIIPMRNLHGMKDNQSLPEFFYENRDQMASFVVGFLLICTIWESINIRSLVIKHTDDFFVMLLLLGVFFISVLPFSLALLGHFSMCKESVLLTCCVLVCVEIVDCVMNVYAFNDKKLLHIVVQKYEPADLRCVRNLLYVKPAFNILMYIIAAVFSVVSYKVSWFFIALFLLLPYIRKFGYFIHRKIYGVPSTQACRFFSRFVKGNISKERVEAFTDAAVAIIACVLILDITVEGFPTKEAVDAKGLLVTLAEMSDEFQTYILCYFTISFLWYINHTVLQLFHTINVVILTLQKIYLLFLCCIPIVAHCIHKYCRVGAEDTKYAVRFAGVVLLFSSSCNLLMFLWGAHVKQKVLHKWASRQDDCMTENCRQHLYIVLKLCNIPFWSVILLFSTLGPARQLHTAVVTVLTLCWISFVILKILFITKWGKKHNAFYNKDDGISDGRCSRATTFTVNTGVVRMAEMNQNGGGTRDKKNLKKGEENPGYVGDEDEDDNDGGLSRAPSVCNSDVSELQSQYGSFRDGLKIINGVKVDVTSCI